MKNIQTFINENKKCIYKTLKELCTIPAPSHHEKKRAEYCRDFLLSRGAKGAYIDDALNVVFPLHCENSSDITVFAAHTDTVFPDTEPMTYIEKDGKIFSPGVGDDTAHVVALLFIAAYFLENNIAPQDGCLFVCNSCEEGLGNLKGTRKLFRDYAGRIKRFVSFDLYLGSIVNGSVGSHRYEVEVITAGGHSYGDFGRENAICELSRIVSEIYGIDVPKKDGCRVTYNVGEIVGGTSVNTIAENAKMLCEYRSNDASCLDIMKTRFFNIFHKAEREGVQVKVKTVGERPCSRTPKEAVEKLLREVQPILEAHIQKEIILDSSSTDANIPLSMGIPALTVGLCRGEKLHTREEWIEKDTLLLGTKIGIEIALHLTSEASKNI